LLTFEDFQPGRVFKSDWHTVTEEEIISFAREFDPQQFHTGVAERTRSLYPSVIASGWHSGSLCQRLMVASFLSKSACLGSPGLDYLRWPAPLAPDDEVRAICQVMEARVSKTRPGMGIVKFEVTLATRQGKVVLQMAPNVFISRAAAL